MRVYIDNQEIEEQTQVTKIQLADIDLANSATLCKSRRRACCLSENHERRLDAHR